MDHIVWYIDQSSSTANDQYDMSHTISALILVTEIEENLKSLHNQNSTSWNGQTSCTCCEARSCCYLDQRLLLQGESIF